MNSPHAARRRLSVAGPDRRFLLVVQTILLLQSTALAQPDELRFEQISMEDGLSQASLPGSNL